MDLSPLLENVKLDADGLVAAVAQDHVTGRVLMLAYMTPETLRQTLETGVMTYWSRSRNRVWVKGEASGHTQRVKAAYLDCDGDALLFEVEQEGGAACHTGRASCFFRRVEDGALVVTEDPLVNPGDLYRAR